MGFFFYKDPAQEQKIENLEKTVKQLQNEKENNEKKEKNKKDIDSFRNSQDISLFLELIERFNYDEENMINTLEAISEESIIKKYESFKKESEGKLMIIESIIYGDYKISSDCQKKLITILLCYEKNKNKCDTVLQKLIDKNNNTKKELLFDILLYYSNVFGKDVHFDDNNIYKEFVNYSLKKNKYPKSLDYRSNDIIQLEIFYEQRDEICGSLQIIIEFNKINQYGEAYTLIEKIIKYEKGRGKAFIKFTKKFWENYYIYYMNNERSNKIEKLLGLYKLLLSYIDLCQDDSEYKDILAGKIHDLIQNKIDEKTNVIEQLNLLFKNDPYYIYDSDKRNPEIFKNINIFDLKKEEDIDFFRRINIEKIYSNKMTLYWKVIFSKIKTIENFNSIIKITKLNDEKNKGKFINLLVQKYSNFTEEETTEESLINLLKKVIEYSPKKKVEILEEFLPRFRQKNNIYLKILNEFKADEIIKEQIAFLSIKNLDLFVSIDLVKNINEDQKKEYFNNLTSNIINYDDFWTFEDSQNLKLLTELMKKKLIPESIYLDRNKDVLNNIYDKLTTYDDKKEKYLETIINEKEDIQKKYIKRFELFKLIKGDQFDSLSEFNNIKDKYLQVKQNLEKAYHISNLLAFYYKETLKEDIEKITNIYKEYAIKDNKVCIWLNKGKDIIIFIKKYKEKADLIKKIKEIKLFQIIYNEFTEGNETTKFDKAKELLDGCKVIFDDIQKGNPDILDNWQNKFRKESGIDEELTKLKEYYKIDNNEGLDKVAKNILIFTKKNIYHSDIKNILYFLNLFEAEKTELTKMLMEKQSEFEDHENLDFKKLIDINNYLEEKQIYINGGKDDSSLIQLIRLFNNKKREINYTKTKDVDSAAALLYRLNPTTDSLKFKDILEYQSCIAFIDDIKEKTTDEKLLTKIKEKIEKDDINKILSTFKNYFINFGSINFLDSNFDGAKDIYENIKDILNSSKFKIEFFKREFKVFDDNKKVKDNIVNDLDGLIQLKDNINLNFEDLPDDNKVNEKRKEEIKKKRVKIEIFCKYVEQLQKIIKYFKKLEDKGCPFLIDITIKLIKEKITYELVNTTLEYKELIDKLKEFCNTIVEYQYKFYKENEYFRLIYDKQLYRLFKKLTHKKKDISSYIRFFTNGDLIKDDVPFYKSKFSDQSKAYKYYREAIEENFRIISKYIENLFLINNTSLDKLYSNIKVKDNLRGIFKCNIEKYNMDLFIIKIFLKLTGTFPIAQNILLTNKETSTGEIFSFMYRAIKCRFNTLFVITISDDFSILHINQMTSLLNRIIRDMKAENTIKDIKDLKPFILFITQNQSGSSRGFADFPEAIPLPGYLKGDENKLEYDLGKDGSIDTNKSSEKEIYNAVRVYTSECSGIGKSYLIKKEIKERGEDYHYFGIGDDITKEELFKKLKRFLKIEIRGKTHVGIHLDLYYTKNIPLMKYFLFAILITKLYQANDNILYIPKDIHIYVEIPNGPLKFLDDYPILEIFKRIDIKLKEQLPLDITNDNSIKSLMYSERENILTHIENKNYLNIINYLCPDKKEDIILYGEKIKNAADSFTKCIYSKILRNPDHSQKNLKEEEKLAYILNFFYFKEGEAIEIQYNAPLIFKTKKGYLEIDIKDKEVKGKDIKYFLNNLKKVMSLDESIEEIEKMIGSYKITEDNYKKMILILFRIFANIPVILMGETGCGKTELIKQLMKMLNKDKEKKNNNFIIKNMHSGVKESEISEVIEKAEEILEKSKNDMVCLFFDEINTTSLLSKMKEIFVSHSLNGKKIDERIRFIGACNPFRQNEVNEKDEGLRFEKTNVNEVEMTYMVNPLPNSMLNYIFYFKSLDDEDVKKYIESIIGEEFPKGEKNDTFLREKAIEAIFFSHRYVREKNGISSVSLRDLQRFKRTYKFFNEYYKNKNEYIKSMGNKISDKYFIESKVLSFILSLFITYDIKIFKYGTNNDYLSNINDYVNDLAKEFQIKEWLDDKNYEKAPFNYLIIKEQEFLIDEMEIKNEKGIGLNTSLKENIFLMFFSIYTQIPLIVVGKPGCSKSLSIQLIIRIMRGEFSNSNFLKKYPTISSTGFQGSETNTPESIENIFKEAEKKIDTSLTEKKILSLLVFDELGLSERSPTNCLKVLHSKLEMSLDPEENKQISFIGISNWRLDAAKMNRTIFLAIPDISLDDVGTTVEAIAKSYNEDIYKKYESQYEILGGKYFNYKEDLANDIKDDDFISNYHGGRDLYNIIKIFSSEMLKNNMTDDPNIIEMGVKKALARNLSGLEIKGESSLKKYIKDINFEDLRTMDLIKDNIISTKDTRFLLLASEKSMFGFLIDIIKKEIEEMNICNSDNNKINYVTYIGSPFKGDRMNISYQTEMIINIENSVAEGKVIILSDLEQIYSTFYDLFNQNYISKDGKKYCRISHGANIQKLALVNEKTKFIVLVDKNNLRKQKLPFLSRFEKHIITFDNLLNEEDRKKSQNIIDLCEKLTKVKDINYKMDNILVNTNDDIINGYVYLYKDKEKNTYKDIIRDKIIPILSQDIIFSLHLSELNNEKRDMDALKKDIYTNIKYNSLEEYLESEKRGKEEILIVYTFSKEGESIKLSEKEKYLEKVTRDIKNIYKFKNILNDLYENKEYKSLILKFDSENAKYINFFITEIKNYKERYKIKNDLKTYIFTINIQRDFNLEKNIHKVTTVLMADETINQLFIDNINGAELSIKDVENKKVDDLIRKGILDPKKLIVEEILNFFTENKNEQLGECKGIDNNNFIKELTIFLQSENLKTQLEDKKEEKTGFSSIEIINDIRRIILNQNDDIETIIDLLLKNKYITQNTTDFITAIITHIKNIFIEKIKLFLRKTEINNFITTIFILNVKDMEKGDSSLTISDNKKNDYSLNISDSDIIKNEIIGKIKKEFLKMIKEDKIEIIKDETINMKINYKIPGFFKIYKQIKEYIEKEKLSFFYRQDETELRKCQYELISRSINKLSDDVKDFNVKLFTELESKQLVTKVTENKITDKDYLEFVELFLNDYITFYLINLYNNVYNFIINDVPHKIILLILDLKFRGIKEDEQYKIPLQNAISKILWLEGNAKYIKEFLDLYNIISENIAYDEKEKDFLFKEILNLASKDEIKYEPKEPHLVMVNEQYYKLITILFKCMINKKSIQNAISRNDNYYIYFKELERCLKLMKNLDKILKLDIKELSILEEFINIYNVFENAGKVENFDITMLINNLTKSLEIIEMKDEQKMKLLKENLENLMENIKKYLYDSSKEKEIKGDKVYYGLISNILLNEIIRENNPDFKLYILEKFLLTDEKLFIQSNQLLKIILEDYVSTNIDKFQGAFDKLSNSNLENLEGKKNNDWINETLLYTFEYITIIYIQNLINENRKAKKENKINVLYNLRSFFQRCTEFLERLYIDKFLFKKDTKNEDQKKEEELKKEPETTPEDKEEVKLKSNNNLKKLFAVAFVRIYLKEYIDWIDKNQLKSSEIEEIIKIINGKGINPFREMILYYLYKILYNKYQQDISKLFTDEIINKFHLNKLSNFDLLKEEKNDQQVPKDILFVEAYDKKNEDYLIYKEEFDKLTIGERNNELENLIQKNKTDIFYSVFSTKISANLSNTTGNEEKIRFLSDITHSIYDSKEKLLKIFELFLNKSKYTKCNINSNVAEILQFSLKFCLNSDEISEDYDNIYYPLYSYEKNINCYIPGNDIKDRKIYLAYSKIKKYLDTNPSSHGVYICTCNLYKNDEELFIKFEEGNKGYPKQSEKCKYCGNPIGNNGYKKSFYNRECYRIFKNEEDLVKETKDKKSGKCKTLEEFYNSISKNLEKDSKGVNISKKRHFDNPDKPIRKQSQIGFRLMNLILYSHLFTSVLFTNNEEYFADEKLTYLDYIVGNWNKLKLLLREKGIDIYVFMNLIYTDLYNYLSKLKVIDDYNNLLEVEKEIENIIENKISKKENIKGKYYTKYQLFYAFYTNSKKNFREKDSDKKSTIIKQINPVITYKEEKDYPFYKNFLYSDYPDTNFFKIKLEGKGIEKYPVVDLYLNAENVENKINKNFLYFNFVIKSLLNEYSGKITKNDAKKLTLEKAEVYKSNGQICNKFIEIINERNRGNNLTIESSLENFLINETTERGKIYIEMYKDYAKIHNDLLSETINKINAINYDIFECPEINIQEAQKEDLLILDFGDKSEFNEIFLMNIFREIYNANSNIKYDNYNLYSVDFDKIEKILEETLVKNACFLKTDEIIEMKYSGEDFLNDGLTEFIENKTKNDLKGSLDEKDKKVFLDFYEKKLNNNLVSCLEIHEGLQFIIKYANKNIKRIHFNKSLYDIVNGSGFPYKICDDLKEFLESNTNLILIKLSDLIIYLEQLYFELAMKNKKEYKEKLEEDTKNKIDVYFREKIQFITKVKLSPSIIKFLLNIIMNQKNNKNDIIDNNDNLFEYLNNRFLWDNETLSDNRFTKEMEELKNLNIYIKNAYEFYTYIANEFKDNLEHEKSDILEKIKRDEEQKITKTKQEKAKNNDDNDEDDGDINDLLDYC